MIEPPWIDQERVDEGWAARSHLDAAARAEGHADANAVFSADQMELIIDAMLAYGDTRVGRSKASER